MRSSLSFHSNYIAKRCFDTFLAAFALALLSPFLAAVAIAIKLGSPGPVFFRQTRVGLLERPFRIFKFRTMVHNQSTTLEVTVGEDNRITRIGRVLRKLKIDELPQLINVILGEMALVGPRPEVPQYADKYSERDRQIVFSVLPGLTDFASIKFRNESELLARQPDPLWYYEQHVMPKKLRYYRFYAKRSCVGLDLYIISLTVGTLLRDFFPHSRENEVSASVAKIANDG
jgi:lipopolysaccharide/colanic/teichoic acid biosynthesis glycosyltransferase